MELRGRRGESSISEYIKFVEETASEALAELTLSLLHGIQFR